VIKTILWDFDGVILDSIRIKGDGFMELFQNHNIADVQILEQYHYANGGVSRFEKIKYFYNQILNKDISEDEILKLAGVFSNIIETKIFDKTNLIEDSLSFIKKNYLKYNFHIVSGAEHNELNSLCKHFIIDKYFISILGSPITKNTLVKNIISDYEYNNDQVILIGDSKTDYVAAKKNKIIFYGYNNTELKKFGNYIEKFQYMNL
jgi:phosphoglycolate phosphatase-like HAD superfamily hydrolase